MAHHGAGASSASMSKAASTGSRQSASGRGRKAASGQQPAAGTSTSISKKRKIAKAISDDEEDEADTKPASKKLAASAKKGRLASIATEENASGVSISRASSASRSIKDSPDPDTKPAAPLPPTTGRKRGRPPKKVPGSVSKAAKRKIVESASDESVASSPVAYKQTSSTADTKGKGRVREDTADSSPHVPLSSRASSRASSHGAESREGTPLLPFVVHQLIKNEVPVDESVGPMTRTDTDGSDLDIDMESVEASAKKLLAAANLSIKSEYRDSVDPRSRQPSLAPSMQAPSEVDGLSVQGDDDGALITPAEELQVELGTSVTPVKRKRGRPKKLPPGQGPPPTRHAPATRASPMPPPAPVQPDVKVTRALTAAERKVNEPLAARAQLTLDIERKLIEAGQHPLQTEALGVLEDLRRTRLSELKLAKEAREQEVFRLFQASSRQSWIDWENSKREAVFEIVRRHESWLQRLDLEVRDSDYDVVMGPYLLYQKPPTVQPIIRMPMVDKDLHRGDLTILPSNGRAADHSILDVATQDVQDDLRLMGLRPVRTKPPVTAAKREKLALRRFPLGLGPKELPNQRKARFISSKHPLRQIKPITPSKRVKKEPEAKVPVQLQPSARKASLDRTATKAAAKLALHKGNTRADAILIDDTSPVMPKQTPLTAQSLAAFEQAEAQRARQMAMQGQHPSQYDTQMYPGRMPPPAAYYNAVPQNLPTQQSQRAYPTIADMSRRGMHEYDSQGRRILPAPPVPPEPRTSSRSEKARRADLAAQARLELGLDPPPGGGQLQHMHNDGRMQFAPGVHTGQSGRNIYQGNPGHGAPGYDPPPPVPYRPGPSHHPPPSPRRPYPQPQPPAQPPPQAQARRRPSASQPSAEVKRIQLQQQEQAREWAPEGPPYYGNPNPSAYGDPRGYAHGQPPPAPGQPLRPAPQQAVRKASGDSRPDAPMHQQQQQRPSQGRPVPPPRPASNSSHR